MASSPPIGKTILLEDGQAATPPVVSTPPPPNVITTHPTCTLNTEGVSTIMDTAQVDDNDKDPVTGKL